MHRQWMLQDIVHEKLFYEFAVVVESWCVAKYEYMSSLITAEEEGKRVLLFKGTRKFFDI